jgi:hypothetical protein
VFEERQREIGEDNADLRVRELARELALVINTGAAEQREELRDMAVRLLRDEVEIVERVVDVPEGSRAFNPFAIAIPLGLAGAVMLILFPPVGLLLFGSAVVMMAWGVAVVLFSGR